MRLFAHTIMEQKDEEDEDRKKLIFASQWTVVSFKNLKFKKVITPLYVG